MSRVYSILAVLLFFSGTVISQPNYPKNYFRWPVNLKPEIVANLGELRPNHWHMGFDVRTNAKENERVYAAAEGYIARIGIRPQSFGRFIVINHPNGLSTLYGHLNDFAPAIEEYASSQQYAQESWAVELDLPPGKLPVSKGSFIAFSGNTGGSQGPHVHFEIRDTRSGKCLNTLLFGFPLSDNVPPSIVKLGLYDRTGSSYAAQPRFYTPKKTELGYVIPKVPVIKTDFRKVSFGIQTFDRITGSSNEDGVYLAELIVDDIPQIRFVIDSISYDETSYMNAHIDFPLKFNGGSFIQHLSRLPGDHGGVYHPINSDGVLEFSDTNVHEVKILVKDAYQNESILQFKVQYTGASTQRIPNGVQKFIPNLVNVLGRSDFEVYLPEIAVYDTIQSLYLKNTSVAANAVSAAHQVNDPSLPFQGNLRVRIKPDRVLTDDWKNRIIIQRSYRGGISNKKANITGTGDQQWLSAEFGDFGVFRAYVDLVAPQLNELGRGDTIDLSSSSRIIFSPTDNFSIRSFIAKLDGKWLRFTNDKSRNWIYRFDERCPFGVHELTVTVEDIAGNITTKTWWFKKYAYTAPKKSVKKSGSKKRTVSKTSSKKKSSKKKK